MLNINENVNLSGIITVDIKDAEGNITSTQNVVRVSAYFNKESKMYNLSYEILNEELLASNLVDVQASINEFKAATNARATAMGYGITL